MFFRESCFTKHSCKLHTILLLDSKYYFLPQTTVLLSYQLVAIINSDFFCVPALLCCNEPDLHRRDWLTKTLESFLPPSLNSRVDVSGQDGRWFGQNEGGFYDKVGK